MDACRRRHSRRRVADCLQLRHVLCYHRAGVLIRRTAPERKRHLAVVPFAQSANLNPFGCDCEWVKPWAAGSEWSGSLGEAQVKWMERAVKTVCGQGARGCRILGNRTRHRLILRHSAAITHKTVQAGPAEAVGSSGQPGPKAGEGAASKQHEQRTRMIPRPSACSRQWAKRESGKEPRPGGRRALWHGGARTLNAFARAADSAYCAADFSGVSAPHAITIRMPASLRAACCQTRDVPACHLCKLLITL